MTESTTRLVGGTEFSWCKAVPTGTGITVVGILFSKPKDISILQNALEDLQNSHPILRSKIHFDIVINNFSFVTPDNPSVHIQPFDLQSTAEIIRIQSDGHDQIEPFHALTEHEMNLNTWQNPSGEDTEVMYASAYEMANERLAVFLRVHTAVCDRVAAAELLGELLRRLSGGGDGGDEKVEDMSLAVEDMIPEEKKKKPFWARGFDMLGYSLNGFRTGHLGFVDADSPRSSRVLWLRFNAEETKNLIDECKSRGVKLCGALAAAGMIASWSSKLLPDNQREKYAVVTLINCRSTLDPVLSNNHVGFYHSAIMNTHDVGKEETFWDLAKRSYTSFANAKNNNKHYTDMADLNFLMCRAMENPGLTPSSSLRTALISVFEEPVINDFSAELRQELGVEDFVGCASSHGIGTSIAIFDSIKDEKLECGFVYPSPLHSKEQIQELADHMKRILLDGFNSEDQ